MELHYYTEGRRCNRNTFNPILIFQFPEGKGASTLAIFVCIQVGQRETARLLGDNSEADVRCCHTNGDAMVGHEIEIVHFNFTLELVCLVQSLVLCGKSLCFC